MKKKVFRERNSIEETKKLVDEIVWNKKAKQIVEETTEVQKYINETKKKTTKKKVGK